MQEQIPQNQPEMETWREVQEKVRDLARQLESVSLVISTEAGAVERNDYGVEEAIAIMNSLKTQLRSLDPKFERFSF